MVANTWILQAESTAKEDIIQWLEDETSNEYTVESNSDRIIVDFEGIDDAFRFRLHFDEALIQN